MGNSNTSRRITLASQPTGEPYEVTEEVRTSDAECCNVRGLNTFPPYEREMGNASSARKITVPNDDTSGVIKVSETVAKRIKGSPADSHNEKPGVDSNQNISSAPTDYPHNINSPGSLTALQVQHSKEEELRKNDQYWMQRLLRQQEAHKAMDRHMSQEYEKAVGDVKGTLFKVPDPNDEVPCRGAKESVAQCYRKNPGKALKCIEEVLAFQACVDLKRMDKIENRA